MTRGLNNLLIAEADSNHIRLVWFVKIEFDSGTIYIHDGIKTYNWDSQDWLGIGDFGSITGLRESTELTPNEIVLSLSGLDADYIADTDFTSIVLTENYYNRPVTIFVGAVDIDTGLLVADPDEIWVGFTDTSNMKVGLDNSVNITCESEFIRFTKNNGRIFSDADQRSQVKSTDGFFRFMSEMQNGTREVIWGGKGVNTGTTVGPSLRGEPRRHF